jgi:two-component system chemotaxis response regulator CheY
MAQSILIVDDSATTRAVIKRAVQLSGVDTGGGIHEAANGKLALDFLAKQPVSLVLADLHMPHMGGIEMTQRILADRKTRDIPVIVISAEPDAQRLEELKTQGVRAWLRKPFTPERVRDVVQEVMGGAHA